MNRRDFIRKSICVTAGSIAAGKASRLIQTPVSAFPDSTPVLVVATGTDYPGLVTDALGPLGGMGAFVKPGYRVVVKPNIGWNRAPEYAANTHPEIVRAVVEQVLKAGASRVAVFDRTCNEERLCYHQSGIKAAIETLKDSRVSCDYIDNRKFVEVDIPMGKSIQKWEFYREALEADLYINVPVAKQHGLTKLSLGLKNVMGVLGGSRGKIHHAIGQRLADLNTIIRPDLTIIDATRMLLRNGPAGGNLEDVRIRNTLTASADIVASDAYVSTLFGYQPEDLDTTVAAHRSGLGEMQLDRIKIVTV
ncbi:DUF362 domain-containing protein [bacterium]|nr:DUF362 domain-containing protein [candidate division CSSED10-310 bacterium]